RTRLRGSAGKIPRCLICVSILVIGTQFHPRDWMAGPGQLIRGRCGPRLTRCDFPGASSHSPGPDDIEQGRCPDARRLIVGPLDICLRDIENIEELVWLPRSTAAVRYANLSAAFAKSRR